MHDDGAKMQAHMVTAEVMIERLSNEAMKYRAICMENIERAREELDRWTTEHDKITGFLVNNQLEDGVFDPTESINLTSAGMMRRSGSH